MHMKYSDEVTARLRDLKKINDASKESEWLKSFQENLNKGSNRKYLVPIFHLLNQKSAESEFFWDALHLWFKRRNPKFDLNEDPKAIINIIKSLEKDKTKQGKENLSNFKTLLINSNLLENEKIRLIQSVEDSILGPGFELVTKSRKKYEKEYKSLLIRLLLHAYGLLQKEDLMTDVNKILSFEDLSYLGKHKLIKKISKSDYMQQVEDIKELAFEDFYNVYDHIGVDIAILNDLGWLPSYANEDVFDADYIFLQQAITQKKVDMHIIGAYQHAIVYLVELIKARSKILVKNESRDQSISLLELALTSNTKNLRTIRNEFFKPGNLLEYVEGRKDYITYKSATAWIKDSKRKQPIYDFLTGKKNYISNFKLKDLEKIS